MLACHPVTLRRATLNLVTPPPCHLVTLNLATNLAAMSLKSLALIFLLALTACTPREQPPEPLASEAMPTREWLPRGKPRAVVLALHGMNDYSHAFALPGDYFAARGIALFAYDQRGFGAARQPGIWAGEENLVQDVAQQVRTLRSRFPRTPLYLLGESMGGAVAIVALSEPGFPPVDGVILSAPAVWGEETFQPAYRAVLWLVAHLAPGSRFDGSDLEIRATDNIALLRQMSVDPLILKDTRADAILGLVRLMDTAYQRAPQLHTPVLLLYGGKDEVIPPAPIEALKARLPQPPTAKFYAGGYHMLLRDLGREAPLRDSVQWMLHRR